MNFHTRKWIKPEDLNPNGSLFGGSLLKWIGMTAINFGTSSITLRCEVRNKISRETILVIEKLIFVNLGDDGKPAPHGKTEITYVRDRFQTDQIG